jgi:hypothetical protein
MRADLHPIPMDLSTRGLVGRPLQVSTLKRPSVKNSEWTSVSVNVNHLAEKA